ncbi:MAG: hypothetical protein GEU90_02445 [Gemmatimonas sp.]|nr:hypothetical protein [Gemmatimonas sp.]
MLVARTFLELRRVDTGFDDQNVLTASVALPPARYGADSEMAAAFQLLRQAIGSVPGVESAAAVRQLPLTRPSWSSDFVIDGRAPDEYGVEVLHREVTPEYFETLRVLYGVTPRDPATLTVAAGVLLFAGLTAAAVPAIRAVWSDPAAILRQE